MICKADLHYRVVRHGKDAGTQYGEIKALVCLLCPQDRAFTANKSQFAVVGKSGLGRYSRMRGAMVRHIHAAHVNKAVAP